MFSSDPVTDTPVLYKKKPPTVQSCVTRQRHCLQMLPISPLRFMSLEMTLIFPEGSHIQKHAKLHC